MQAACWRCRRCVLACIGERQYKARLSKTINPKRRPTSAHNIRAKAKRSALARSELLIDGSRSTRGRGASKKLRFAGPRLVGCWPATARRKLSTGGIAFVVPISCNSRRRRRLVAGAAAPPLATSATSRRKSERVLFHHHYYRAFGRHAGARPRSPCRHTCATCRHAPVSSRNQRANQTKRPLFVCACVGLGRWSEREGSLGRAPPFASAPYNDARRRCLQSSVRPFKPAAGAAEGAALSLMQLRR
jgi:hypothetical protein